MTEFKELFLKGETMHALLESIRKLSKISKKLEDHMSKENINTALNLVKHLDNKNAPSHTLLHGPMQNTTQ